MKKVTVAVICAGLIVSGCSRNPDRISGSYVSPLQYQAHTCNQLQQELARISTRAAEVAGIQSDEATKDAVAMGAGLFLFWPALFFLGGGGDREEELARLRGEIEAIESSAIQKDCTNVASQIAKQREAAKKHQAGQS